MAANPWEQQFQNLYSPNQGISKGPDEGDGGDGTPPGGKGPKGSDPCPAGQVRETLSDGTTNCVASGENPGSHTCPADYFWEQGDPAQFPNGRCVPNGCTWESAQGGQCGSAYQNPPSSSSGGSSSGGGGGASTSVPNSLDPNWGSTSLNDQYGHIFDDLMDETNKLSPRWNKDNLALVKGNLRASTAGEAKRQKDALIAQRSAMGTLKSGTTDRALRQIQEDQGGKYSSGATGIDVTAVGENFGDQIAILEKKQQNVQQQASWLLGLASNDAARASITNSLAIALKQIQAQKDNLNAQLSMQKYLAQLGLAGGLFGSST